jgi:hypothetical protein
MKKPMNQSSRPLRLRPAAGSWPDGWVVRLITMDDLRTMLGCEMDPEYCAAGPFGFAAEYNGVLAATGAVTWDMVGRCWGWFNYVRGVPPRLMHVCALEALWWLRRVEEPYMLMIVDQSKDGAERWARRLGFVPDTAVTHHLGPVYRCNLS